MRRFDLLDEYTSAFVPKFSRPRSRPTHQDAEGGDAKGDWRYGVAGVIAIVLVALVAI